MLLLAVIGGLLGSCFNYLNSILAGIRKAKLYKYGPRGRIWEGVVCALLTSTISFLLPMMVSCAVRYRFARPLWCCLSLLLGLRGSISCKYWQARLGQCVIKDVLISRPQIYEVRPHLAASCERLHPHIHTLAHAAGAGKPRCRKCLELQPWLAHFTSAGRRLHVYHADSLKCVLRRCSPVRRTPEMIVPAPTTHTAATLSTLAAPTGTSTTIWRLSSSTLRMMPFATCSAARRSRSTASARSSRSS